MAFSVTWMTSMQVENNLRNIHVKDETFAGQVLPPLSTSLAHHVQVLEGVSHASTTSSASSKRRLHPGRRVGSVMVDFLDFAEGQRNFF